MPKLDLSIAVGDYDRVRPLIDGAVGIDGVAPLFMTLEPEEVFFRAFRHAEFDIAELSLSSFTVRTARGDNPYVGVPVFLSRAFRHSGIYVRTDRGIRAPADLKGRKVGLAEYQLTANVWIRAFLDDDFGLTPASVEWVRGGIEEPGRPEKIAIHLPADVRLTEAPPGRSLSEMLLAGEIDALIGPRTPSAMAVSGSTVGWLFPDPRAAAIDSYRRTGNFPIMHLIGVRRTLVEQRPTDKHTLWIESALPMTYVADDSYDYEPATSDSIAARAQAEGRNPWAYALEAMMARQGKALLSHTFENYTEGSLAVIREMLVDEATIVGLGDGGAHVCIVCDASSPTFLLSHWARDRKRGPGLPLEFLVRKQTRDSAFAYGLRDRGVLAEGYKADINIIDFDRLRVLQPEVVYDLPAGGKRLVQRAQGYRHIFVSGKETVRDDEHTGELPGKLLR